MSDESRADGDNFEDDGSGLGNAKLFDDRLVLRECQDYPELAHRLILSSLMIRLISKMFTLIVSHEIVKVDFNITELFTTIYNKKKNTYNYLDSQNSDMKRDYEAAYLFMEEFGTSLQAIKSEFSVDFFHPRHFRPSMGIQRMTGLTMLTIRRGPRR